MLKQASLAVLICAGSLLAQNYVIKGPANPKPHETQAIKELTDYLARRIGNGTLTVDGKSPITFQVGDTDLAKSNGISSTEQADEKWFIKSVGDQVILNGGGTRGALYATYHFLEDYCDVHWWSDFEDYVPEASSLELTQLDASGKPAFLYRDIHRGTGTAPITSTRNRLNRCGDAKVPKELGGSFNYGPPYHCHTFDKYIPASEYLDTHPEYFSLVNGKRVGGMSLGQLCLTNPELKNVFLEKLLKYIEQGDELARKNGVPAPRIYDVSMNDNRKYCTCPECTAASEEYGQSGLHLNFVNWIAREVKKTRPNIYISMLAYFYTEPPPKGGVRADDNVIVKLCDTTSNIAASILEPDNKTFHDFVAQWKNYAKNLFIWDYAITFAKDLTGLPCASEFHYGDLYKYYFENNVTGIFWQHEEPDKDDLYELKFFIECKLFEDPYQNIDKLIDTFLNCYYGAAAPFILEYRKALDETRKANKGFISWFPAVDDFKFIPTEDIAKFQKLFDAAETAVEGDKTLSARVRHARCGLDRLTCARCASIPYHGTKKFADDVRLDATAAAKRQIDAWPEWCLQFYDGNKLATEARHSLQRFAPTECKTYPAPEEFKDRNFYDFYPYFLDNHDKKNISIVKDDESQTGETVKINVAGDKNFAPPFKFGIHRRDTNKTVLIATVPISTEPGYHWYTAGKVKIPEKGFMFLTRAWTYQLQPCVTGISGNEFEIWAHIKVTGPIYRPGDTEPDFMYIDRILFVEPKE